MAARHLRACLLLLACLIWGTPSWAEPTDADRERAKELFDRGKAAMGVGRFAEAQQSFSQSLALVPKASAAFNLAVALRGTGKPKEASAVLARLGNGDYGPVPPEMSSQAQQLEKETRRDIGTLVVVQRGARRASVRVDGIPVGQAVDARPLLVQVNPGQRLVSVEATLRETKEIAVTVAAGQNHPISFELTLSRAARVSTLELVAKSPDAHLEIVGVARGRGRLVRKLQPGTYRIRLRSDDGDRDSEGRLRPATRHRVELEAERGGVLQSPWFWAAAGTLTVGAAVGGYFLLRNPREAPVTDPEFNVVETLRAARF